MGLFDGFKAARHINQNTKEMDDAFDRRHQMFGQEVDEIAKRGVNADPGCLPIAMNAAGASLMFIENLPVQMAANSRDMETELLVEISDFFVNDEAYIAAKELMTCAFAVDDIADGLPHAYSDAIAETTKLLPALGTAGAGIVEFGPLLNWHAISDRGELTNDEPADDGNDLIRFHTRVARQVGEHIAPNNVSLFVMRALIGSDIWFSAWNKGLEFDVNEDED